MNQHDADKLSGEIRHLLAAGYDALTVIKVGVLIQAQVTPDEPEDDAIGPCPSCWRTGSVYASGTEIYCGNCDIGLSPDEWSRRQRTDEAGEIVDAPLAAQILRIRSELESLGRKLEMLNTDVDSIHVAHAIEGVSGSLGYLDTAAAAVKG